MFWFPGLAPSQGLVFFIFVQTLPMFYTLPKPFRRLTSPWLTWEKPRGGKTIYLTFDDGPDPEITHRVAEILEDYNARATFFLTGSKAGLYPQTMDMLTSGGHALGNHGFDHLRGFSTPNATYMSDVEKCAGIVSSRLFRPPYGSLRPGQVRLLRNQGYEICMWSVITRDYDPRVSPNQCLDHCLRKAGDGSVVLFHDSPTAARNVLFALPRLLAHFSGRGYGFEAWDHLVK
jgi:peptidoglycan-N-acetylglucosamine deacetylase